MPSTRGAMEVVRRTPTGEPQGPFTSVIRFEWIFFGDGVSRAALRYLSALLALMSGVCLSLGSDAFFRRTSLVW